jgi:hypothetical protein
LHSTPEEMTLFASHKLEGKNPSEHNRLLAALCQRFSLRFEIGTRDGVAYVNDSVASQMRFVIDTAEDRSWQFTCYPSEPVLSNAAAAILYQPQGEEKNPPLTAAIILLADKIGARVIDKGEYGELISRILLLVSRDVTAIRVYNISGGRKEYEQIKGGDQDEQPDERQSFRKFPSNPAEQYFDYLRPVAVLDFLDTLLGPAWTKEENGLDQRTRIKNLFKNAFISASHWKAFTGKNIGERRDVKYVNFAFFTATVRDTNELYTGPKNSSEHFSSVGLLFSVPIAKL